MERPDTLEYSVQGFSSYVTNCGIKDTTLDLGVVYSHVPAAGAAIFTKNQFVGEPIKIGRKHNENGIFQALVVNSKNANVATGEDGYKKAMAICSKVATELSIDVTSVLPSSTGVIGHPLPFEKVVSALDSLSENLNEQADFADFAKSIMTTDTFPKFVSAKIGDAVLVGVAKGSGMIEPNMATMLSYFFTDAKISSEKLDGFLRKAANKTFNRLSVDTDTSTSDTLAIFANGLAGEVDEELFYTTLEELCTKLTRMLARDGEGATKLFLVDVNGAANDSEAEKIGRSIVNSPLVKTMIYKGDPNWGRVWMAVGKTTDVRLDESKFSLAWGADGAITKKDSSEVLTRYLQGNEEIILKVNIGVGEGSSRFYGCDLTEGYVKINAYYTT
ncbi:MAG: bifunctional glutamate N-acetyltransferase/amino-acid acetyltransferase ArgJ [Leptospirales bacterium]